MSLQNSEILLPCLKLTVKNYKKKIKKNRIFMACYWIEYVSQYNFSDLIIIIIFLQGSYPFSETIFQDFSRTFPGFGLIFPGLQNSP